MGIAILLLMVSVALVTTRRPSARGEGWVTVAGTLALVLGYQAVSKNLL